MFAVELHGEGQGNSRLDELSREAHAAIGRPYVPHISASTASASFRHHRESSTPRRFR